jgi:DNA-directed RNA polymerase specialized sigma subunit
LERRVIALRYYEGRTAREACRELSLDGQREVYTVESRAIRRLRGMFET